MNGHSISKKERDRRLGALAKALADGPGASCYPTAYGRLLEASRVVLELHRPAEAQRIREAWHKETDAFLASIRHTEAAVGSEQPSGSDR